MTTKEIQKRNVKANQLKVMLSDQGKFFVESSKGKILYNVVFDNDVHGCTCGDYGLCACDMIPSWQWWKRITPFCNFFILFALKCDLYYCNFDVWIFKEGEFFSPIM